MNSCFLDIKFHNLNELSINITTIKPNIKKNIIGIKGWHLYRKNFINQYNEPILNGNTLTSMAATQWRILSIEDKKNGPILLITPIYVATDGLIIYSFIFIKIKKVDII
jgi:hypothetical protein